MIIILLLVLLYLILSNRDNFKNTNDFTIISNTCVGFMVLQKFDKKFNNPFIGSIFIDDNDYIKLANNFIEYINYEPVLYIPTGEKCNKYALQTNSKYYIHDLVKTPYPIFLLKDIEIHYVHEHNNEITLNKYYRRITRLKEIINNNHKIFITLSFSEFLNKHDSYELMIDKFLEKSNNDNIIKLFIGPPQFYKKEYGKNYMIINEWTNFNFERNKSNLFISNDQYLSVDRMTQLVNSFL